jgi:hypothetical protein
LRLLLALPPLCRDLYNKSALFRPFSLIPSQLSLFLLVAASFKIDTIFFEQNSVRRLRYHPLSKIKMLVNSLFVLASAALALASPVKNYGPGSSCKPGKPMPTLPLNGGGKSIVSSLIH